MGLIAPLSENHLASRSYSLFHVAIQAPLTDPHTEMERLQATRIAMHGAYKWDTFFPCAEDPQDFLAFLTYRFYIAIQGGENQDGWIQNALRALAYVSSDVTEALKTFNPTESSFVQGICHVFQDDKPFQLCKAALFLLPLVGDRWFNTPDPILEPDQMKGLCEDWASAVDGIELTSDLQKATLSVFFRHDRLISLASSYCPG